MCLWYGDLGETGRYWHFDPFVQSFKRLGFDVDTFYDSDKQSVLNAIKFRTKEKQLQGLFVMGHGDPGGFGTGDGPLDFNPQRVWITYAEINKVLEYKLGVAVLWVCNGGSNDGRSILSQSGECVFDGVDRTFYPIIDYTRISTLFPDHKQGTK
jgi:hypothetical protein